MLCPKYPTYVGFAYHQFRCNYCWLLFEIASLLNVYPFTAFDCLQNHINAQLPSHESLACSLQTKIAPRCHFWKDLEPYHWEVC